MAFYLVSSATEADAGFVVTVSSCPTCGPSQCGSDGDVLWTTRPCGPKFGLQVCVFLTQREMIRI